MCFARSTISSPRSRKCRDLKLDDVDAVVQGLREIRPGQPCPTVACGWPTICGHSPAPRSRKNRPVELAFSWITRNNLTCIGSGRSAISSRNSVPSSALWTSPTLSLIAPVKLPLRWPKNSLSMSSAGIAPQLTGTKGPSARGPDLVNEACDELFAGTGLSRDVYRGLGARHLLDHLAKLRAWRAEFPSKRDCDSSCTLSTRSAFSTMLRR